MYVCMEIIVFKRLNRYSAYILYIHTYIHTCCVRFILKYLTYLFKMCAGQFGIPVRFKAKRIIWKIQKFLWGIAERWLRITSCMYECMYVYIYVCMNVCMYVCMCFTVRTRLSLWNWVYIRRWCMYACRARWSGFEWTKLSLRGARSWPGPVNWVGQHR